MLLAGKDDISFTRGCEELVKRLGGDFPLEMRVYPEAHHAFDVPDLHRSSGGTGEARWATTQRRPPPRAGK